MPAVRWRCWREISAALALSGFIFKRFPYASPLPPSVVLELAGDGPATFALRRDGSLVYCKTAAATAARLLLAEAVHSLSVNCQQAVLLHAAAVVHGGKGVLLPGPSGAGKSTLAGWLDHHGFGSLSDEIIGIASADAPMLAFPRPICLETDAHAALGNILDFARREGRLLENQDALLLTHRNPTPPCPVPVKCIIFPRYIAQGETALRPLPKAGAAIRLLGSVANAHSRPDRGFKEIGNLIGRVPAFELCYGAFDGCADAIIHALSIGPGSLDRGESGVTAQSAG